MDIIKTEGLEYAYPDGTQALKGISIAIEKGTKVAFVGNNGAGKSTLFLHFNGTFRPGRGMVMIEGKPIKYDRKSLINLRKKVGMVFQDPDDQLFGPTVKQDVAFGPMNLNLPRDEVDRHVKYALKSVGMEAYADKPPHFLSGGQKKRVAIAGVLAMEPEIIVMDEPASGLDPQGSADIIEILDELNADGKTIVFSTHDVDLAAKSLSQ
jgi:cobalt/nickel transport system ATP-binding protein